MAKISLPARGTLAKSSESAEDRSPAAESSTAVPRRRAQRAVSFVTALAFLFSSQPLALAQGADENRPAGIKNSEGASAFPASSEPGSAAGTETPLVLSDSLDEKGYSRELDAEGIGENSDEVPGEETTDADTETTEELITAADVVGSEDRTGVSGKIISVPSGEGTVQGMEESFSAQLSTGIATFSVPFAMPAARGAAQPSLGLSYSSSGGFGNAGVGWNIGVPFIARESDRGLPQYDDRAAWHPEQDRFVFNGGQELVPICTIDTEAAESSGVCPGALPDEAFPEWSHGWQYFRARVEGSFLRFFWAPNHQTWRVQDKSGVSMELGVPLDGTGYAAALERNPSKPSEVFKWSLVRQYDTYGSVDTAANPQPHNVVVYRYAQHDGEAYLTDIFDTTPLAALSSANLASYAHHTRLTWEPRTDTTHSYRTGWRIDQTQRLKRVDVTSKPFAGGSAAPRELLRRYHLAYDAAYHVSLLQSVQVEGRCQSTAEGGFASESGATSSGGGQLPSTSCPMLPPMTFDYSHVQGYLASGSKSGPAVPGFEPFDERVITLPNSPPKSLDEARTALLDVDGNGLEDVLVTEPGLYGGSHGLFLNGGSGQAGSFTQSSIGVSGVLGAGTGTISLSNLNVVPMDADGDAVVNLLHMPRQKQYALYSPELQGGKFVWVGRVVSTADSLDPRIDLGKDGFETRTFDVNFDGLIDVVRATGTQLQTFYSLGRYPGGDGQFGSATLTGSATASISNEAVTSCVPFSGSALTFNDNETMIADMNGDGITDIVKLQRGNIRYWPGRGNGFWGTGERDDCAAGSFGSDRHYPMANSPHFSDIEQSSLQLNDVNGDGFSDLVQVRFTAVDVWLNLNGDGFAERYIIEGTPAAPGFQNRVRLTDINGSGTPDILWGDANNYKYIDLAGGTRPWVLSHVDNGLGKTTDLEYSSSTAEMLAAAAAGQPWKKVMPTVTQVVKRVTEHDNLTIAGRPPASYVTEYSYRDPVFEGRQREFRGFAVAQAKKIGDANSPTSVSRSEFLLGECVDETPSNGVNECDNANRWRDNPREALKGLPVINETFDENGVYLSSTHHHYQLRRLYRGLDGRDVRWAFENETTNYLYDTGPYQADASPLKEELASVSTDYLASAPGDEAVPEQTATFIRRSHKGHRKTQSAAFVDAFGNKVRAEARGVISGDGASADESISTHSIAARVPSDSTGWLWRTSAECTTGDLHQPAGYVFNPAAPCSGNVTAWGHVQHSYDAHGQLLQTDAVVEGSVLLHREVADAADVAATRSLGSAAPHTISAVSSSTYNPDTGVALTSHGANYRESAVAYDATYGQLPITETIYTRNADFAALTGSSVASLTAEVLSYDRGLGTPLTVQDIHGQTTKAVFDGFGRVTATYAPDPNTGLAQSTPSTLISYALPPETGGRFSRVHTQAQDGANENSDQYLERYAYIDGFGRTVASLLEAEAPGGATYGAGEARRWIVGAMQEWDQKSAVRRKYIEHFFTGDPTQFNFTARPSEPYGRQRYDAFGRALQTYDLDGTVTLQSVYHALSTDMWDAADLQPGPHQGTPASTATDGHGRTTQTIERFHDGNVVHARHTLTQYTPGGQPEVIRRRLNGQTTGEVSRWFAYDSLGRMVLNVEPNTSVNYTLIPAPNFDFKHETRSATIQAWRYAYNDAGDLVSTSDARGCGVNYLTDGAGRVLGEDILGCEAHHPSYTSASYTTVTSGTNLETFYQYDAPATGLGPSSPSCTQNPATTTGRLVRTRDLASDSIVSYDGRGRATCTATRVAAPRAPQVKNVVNGAAVSAPAYGAFNNRYTPRWYERSFAFDAADRPVEETTGAKLLLSGGNGRVISEYNERGAIKSISSSYGDAAGTKLINHIHRTAENLVTEIEYGDLARTATNYTYDERRRIRTVLTARSKQPTWADAPTDPAALENFVHQLILQDEDFAYDAVNNPIEIRDYRIQQEWPEGAKPVNKRIEYDDFYRASRIDYDYELGDDAWKSPYDWELNGADAAGKNVDPRLDKPSPHVAFNKRVLWQAYQYDWLGNTKKTDDDAKGFYDRSLGTVGNGTANAGPYQLTSASSAAVGPQGNKSGSLDVIYDDSGNMTQLRLQRSGECLGGDAGDCSQAFVYLWDELGRLTEALRVDGSSGAPNNVTAGNFGAQLQYRYSAGDQRVLKTAYDFSGNTKTTAYIFPTLELRSAPFVNTDGVGGADDYALNELTEVPYLVANGVRLARVAFMANTTPNAPLVTSIETNDADVNSGQIHVFFELGDHLGSTNSVLDKATGELVNRSTFQAYGGKESAYRPAAYEGFREAYGFTGKEEDAEVGLIYFGFRFYNPLLQRWASPDPLEIHSPGEADANLYAYVSGAALKNIDPLGLQSRFPQPNTQANAPEEAAKQDGAGFGYAAGMASIEHSEKLSSIDASRAAAKEALKEIGYGSAGRGKPPTPQDIDAVFDKKVAQEHARYGKVLSAILGDATRRGQGSLGQQLAWERGFTGGLQKARDVYTAGKAFAAEAALAVVGYGLGRMLSVVMQTRQIARLQSITAARGAGKLTSLGNGQWRSSAGLVYGQGSKHGNRVKHVLDHATATAGKAKHSVFSAPRNKILGVIDDAWARRGTHTVHPQSGNWNYRIKAPGVGTAGENFVNISVRPGTSEIITAFPEH